MGVCNFFIAETLTSFVQSTQVFLPFHVMFLLTFFMIVGPAPGPVHQIGLLAPVLKFCKYKLGIILALDFLRS